MPKRGRPKGSTSARSRASAQINGARGGRPSPVVTAAGKTAAKVTRQALSALARYQKARAGTQEQIEIAKKRENAVRDGELIPAADVRAWGLRLVASLRREVDALPTLVEGCGLDQAVTDATRKVLGEIATRCRQRLASAPQLAGEKVAS